MNPGAGRPNCKGMSGSDTTKTTGSARPDLAPGQEGAPDSVQGSAREFSPDFATLRNALETGRTGVWSWDVATDAVTWSNDFESIHSLPPGSFDGTHLFFEPDIRDQDRPEVVDSLDEAVRTGQPYLARYRVPSRDGEIGRASCRERV